MTASSQHDETRHRELAGVKRIVVKIGSGVIVGGGDLRPETIARLAADVSQLRSRGHEILLVVSGAVAGGYRELSCPQLPTRVVERQAAASIGQYKLMMLFGEAFARHHVGVAQLLMMQEDIEDRRRFISARHTIQRLIDSGIVPIINENDPLADDEAKVGDNDHLAALVTNLSSADLLVMLSSVPGVYRNGSDHDVIPEVDVGMSVDEHIRRDVSRTGVGGMIAKVSAAKLASQWGVPTIIADGTQSGNLGRILEGRRIGTIFLSKADSLPSRKRWIAFRQKSRGAIRVDNGAKLALIERGASLLPSGIIDVEGAFAMGARVDVQDDTGQVFAVGLTSYSAQEVRRIKGRKRGEFEEVLGYTYVDEIINRDDMVLLKGGDDT
ncbi:MAG: glutamate 5-kinase [Phycisphaerae bacterium]